MVWQTDSGNSLGFPLPGCRAPGAGGVKEELLTLLPLFVLRLPAFPACGLSPSVYCVYVVLLYVTTVLFSLFTLP